MKHKMKKTTMAMYGLALLLLAGCGKEELSGEFSEEETETRLEIERIEEETETGAETGRIEEESPAEEMSAEENKTQQETEPDQNTPQDAGQQKLPEEEVKDTGAARLQKYQTVLTDLITKQMYPDGTESGLDAFNAVSGDKFAIFDVDRDGDEELILCITSTATAGMREVVYDYDEEKDTVREEYSGFPGGVFYESGLVEEGLSHNQGLAPLGDFWPYMLYRYQAGSDSYQCIFMVDAWEKEFREQDYDGNSYPEEIDAEKSGIVYYLMEGGAFDMTSTVPVSKTRYEEWRKEQGLGGTRIEIPFQALTNENVENCGTDRTSYE
ncbi:MAG: hypothetical protein K2H37_05400 [Lachnospiraceae bacterium]|nr:hypothetical protein [Lachnospiraceae bacterium]